MQVRLVASKPTCSFWGRVARWSGWIRRKCTVRQSSCSQSRKSLMYSDCLIGVIFVAVYCSTDVCGGFYASPNGLHKIDISMFSRVTGKRNENPLDLSLFCNNPQEQQGTTRAPGVAPLNLAMRRGNKISEGVMVLFIMVAVQLCSEVKGPLIPVPRDPGKSSKNIFSATQSGKHKFHRIFPSVNFT